MLVGLRTSCVDLATHLLSDKAELATRLLLIVGYLAEVLAVVLESNLLLGDVELLDIEYHLLFQAVVVYLHAQLFDTLADALAYSLHALSLEWDDLVAQLLNQIHATQKVSDKDCTLLLAEGFELLDSALYGGHDSSLLLLRCVGNVVRKYIRHLHYGRDNGIVVGSNTCVCQSLVNLLYVGREERLVDARCGGSLVRCHRYEQIDLASYYMLGCERTNIILELSVCGRKLQTEVELLGVE